MPQEEVTREYPIMKTNCAFWRNNMTLWRKTFWEVWEPLPFDVKLAWIAFVSQTIAVITLIEMLLLKK